MENRDTGSNIGLEGRIDRKTHDVSDLKKAYPEWDSFSEKQKLQATRSVEPVDIDTVYNVTTDELHKYFVRNLDRGDSSPEANLDAQWLALGTSSADGVGTGDTDLNTRTYEEQITDVANNGKDLLASTFLDSTEGNGNTFDEIGLFTGDPNNASGNPEIFMINHATFSGVTKDNSKTVTFDVTISFSDN